MKRMLVGFAIAFVLGMIMGIATGTVKWVDETLGRLVLGLQSLPSITWLPLAILWFGLSEKAIIFVVVMGSVCAIAISARDGVRNIPVLQRRAAQVFGASRWQTIRYVTLPGMLPSMAQGLKLGWSFSWRSLMAGEADLRQRRPRAPAAAGPRPEQHGARAGDHGRHRRRRPGIRQADLRPAG